MGIQWCLLSSKDTFGVSFLLITTTAQLSHFVLFVLLYAPFVVMTPLLMSANCCFSFFDWVLLYLPIKWAISTFVDSASVTGHLTLVAVSSGKSFSVVSVPLLSCVLLSAILLTELASHKCISSVAAPSFEVLLSSLKLTSFDACCYCGIWLVNDLGLWWMIAAWVTDWADSHTQQIGGFALCHDAAPFNLQFIIAIVFF